MLITSHHISVTPADIPEVDSKKVLTASSNWSEVIFGFFLTFKH
jgi:hypothetical protein